MEADPVAQKWWKETDPCQIPLEDRAPNERKLGVDERSLSLRLIAF